MRDFIEGHFDKLLLTALFLILVFIVLHMAHDQRDTGDVNWAREQANLIIGALIGLITGMRISNGGKHVDLNGSKPDPVRSEKPTEGEGPRNSTA